VFSVLGLRLRAEVTRLVTRISTVLCEATRPCQLATGALKDLTRSRSELMAENALPRQQLMVASRKVKRPEFKPHVRGLLVWRGVCVAGATRYC
jgi:hypothetical protein